MKNYQIDWKNLTKKEAEEILTGICASFNVLAKCWDVEGLNQVSYLEIDGPYTEDIKKK